MSGTGIRVSQMPVATPLVGTEVLEVVQGGQSRQALLSAVLAGVAPVVHTHAIAAVTGLQASLNGKAATVHTHAIAQVTGLQAALDGKATVSGPGGVPAHTHVIADVTGLLSQLSAATVRLDGLDAQVVLQSSQIAGRAAIGHTHVLADVAGLAVDLAGKAAVGQATTSGLTLNAVGILGRRTAGTGALEILGIGAGLAVVGSNLTAPSGSVSIGANTWTGAQSYNGQELIGPSLVHARVKTVDRGTQTAAQAFVVSAGGHQKLTVAAPLALSFSGWAASGLSELVIELVDGGAHILTWPTIRWVKSDGSFATVFSASGVVLNTSGTDWVLIWTSDGGTTLWGKVLR